MKAALAILVGALCVASLPAMAKEEAPARPQMTPELALWQFARCSVARDTPKISRFVETSSAQGASSEQLTRFVRQFPACQPQRVQSVMPALQPDDVVGALSAAVFVKQHRGSPLPDYSSLAPLVTGERIAAAADDDAKARLFLLAFGDCLVRHQPNHARAFIAARPGSPAADNALRPMLPIMGSCLPVKEGTQISFTKIKLRAVMGNAAYQLDKELAAVPAGSQGTHD